MSAALLGARTIVVQRSPGFLWQAPQWALLDEHELQLASVARRPGGWGLWGAHHTYDVTGADGVPVWVLEQRSGTSKSRFSLADAVSGGPVGTIEQENAWFAPQLRLEAVSGMALRLDGGRMGSWSWTIVDGAGTPYGEMTRHSAGLLSFVAKERTYVVERTEQLGLDLWPLAVMASICLDIVHDRKAASGDGGGATVG